MAGLTSLARQLQQQRLQQPTLESLKVKQQPKSFLYQFKDAGSIDRDTHLRIAQSGLHELCQLDHEASSFQDTLFADSSLHLQKSTMSKQESHDLNHEIERFLLKILSPHFLHSASHKCLEWLIQRYRVHEQNTNALIFSVLPYHETLHFTRLLQLCPLADNPKFAWLAPLQKTGTPLVKHVLHEHLATNLDRLRTLSDRLLENAKLNYNISLWTSFLTSTLICLFEKLGTSNENLLTVILQFISRALSISKPILSISACTTFGFLCSKTQFKESRVQTILSKMGKSLSQLSSDQINEEFLLCLCLICRHQKINNLPGNLTDVIIKRKLLANPTSHHQPLLGLVIKSLLPQLNEHKNHATVLQLLNNLDARYTSILDLIQTISMYQHNENLVDKYAEIIRILERRYPNEFDAAVSSFDDKDFSSIFQTDLYIRLNNTSISLLNALQHHNLEVQLAGIERISQLGQLNTLDADMQQAISTSICYMFNEQDRKLLARLLSLNCLPSLVPKQKLVVFGSKLLDKCCRRISIGDQKAKSWIPIRDKLLQLLLSLEYSNQEFCDLFSAFIFPSVPSRSDVLNKLLKSKCANQFQFLQKVDINEANADNQELLTMLFKAAAQDCSKDSSLIDTLVTCSVNCEVNLVCAICILCFVIQKPLGSQLIEQHIQKMLNLLVKLLDKCEVAQPDIKHLKKNLNACFALQLEKAAEGILIVDFVHLVVEQSITFFTVSSEAVVSTLFKQQDSFLIQMLNIICDLIYARQIKSSKSLLAKFTKKVDRLYNHQFFISLWIYSTNLQLQARALAISSYTFKNYKLTEMDTLYLLIALASPSESVRSEATRLLLSVDSSSNQLLITMLNYKNDYVASNKAAHRVIPAYLKNLADTRGSVLQTIFTALDDHQANLVLTHGLLKVLRVFFNQQFYDQITRISTALLKADPPTLQERLVLMSIFDCLHNCFSQNVKSLNYEYLIEAFCSLLKAPQCKQMTMARLSGKWLNVTVKSKSLRLRILQTLLDEFISTQNSLAKNRILQITCDGDLVAHMIVKFTVHEIMVEKKEYTSYKRIKLKKRIPFDASSANWKKVFLLLEAIQSKSELLNSNILMKHCFKLLSETLTLKDQHSAEYLQQLLLFNIHNCVQQPNCDIGCFSISTLIDSLKFLRLRATQHELLKILNLVTPYFSKEILDNFITIFTYIGTNVLRHDDEHSRLILENTMNSILPPLFKHGNDTILPVLDTFIDALIEIPQQRRIYVFEKLVCLISQTGQQNALWTAVHRLNFIRTKDLVLNAAQFDKFVVELICRFPINDQLITLVKILIHLDQCDQKGILFHDQNLQLSRLFLSQLEIILTHEPFIVAVAEASWPNHKFHFENMLQKILYLIGELSSVQHPDSPQLIAKLYSILDKCNQLLPLCDFSSVLQYLLNSENSDIQNMADVHQRSLKMLVAKLGVCQANTEDVEIWAPFFEPLAAIVMRVQSEPDNAIALINGQYALVALKLISQKFKNDEARKKKMNKLIKLILESLNKVSAGENDKSLKFISAAILCLARISSNAPISAFPQIAALIKSTLAYMLHQSDLLTVSSTTALAKYTQLFAKYLGMHLVPILQKLSLLRLKLTSGNAVSNQQISIKLNAIEHNLTSHVDFDKMVQSFDETHDKLMKKHSVESITSLLYIVQKQFDQASKETLENQILIVKKLVLKLLSFRMQYKEKVATEKIHQIEDQVLTIVCSFLPKLSESKFRRFIVSLHEWALGDNIGQAGSHERMLTFYRLNNQLTVAIKELFTIIVLPVIAPDCIEFLRQAGQFGLSTDYRHEIQLHLLQTIAASLQFNSGEVFNDILEKLIIPIAEQISEDFGTRSQYEQRICEGITHCIGNFVGTFNNYALIKEVHLKILSKTRVRKVHVKLASLTVLHQFVMTCAEEYVAYLPDAAQYLVELYEDDSDEIQRQLITLFRDIEQIIGEPISNYM